MTKRLEELISQIQYMGGLESRLAEHLIANDVVPVVRCKDCKYRYYNEYQEMYCCERWADGFDTVVCQDDFCSYGERKDNG